jgi:RNA polymerase sigma-70 factor (ECF subfamily)
MSQAISFTRPWLKDICAALPVRDILERRRTYFPGSKALQISGRLSESIRMEISHLIRQHSDRLYFIILRMVQSESTAEDILQDTWILVMRKLHQYDTTRPIAPWLTQIAVNGCRSYWRKERVRGLFKPEPPTKNDFENKSEARILADKVLQKLSRRLREVVVLKFYSGMTNAEIAETLNIRVGTVKSRLNYALAKMRKSFDRGEVS